MHEMSLAASIIESCREAAGSARVLRLNLEVGALCCVMPEALHFCFDAITHGTPMEGCKLAIARIPARRRCIACGATVLTHDLLAPCPCGSLQLELPQGGDELTIRSIDIEEEN